MQQAKSNSASDLFFHFFAAGFPDACRHQYKVRSTSNPFRINITTLLFNQEKADSMPPKLRLHQRSTFLLRIKWNQSFLHD
jgi:hypothetical protein